MRRVAVLVCFILAALPVSESAASDPEPASIAVRSDFNGDGIGDLAIGTPLESLGAIGDAGAVNVLYGTPSGLSASGDQWWHQDFSGDPSTIGGDPAEANDHFGSALAPGDFNADGFADLAIGVPDEDLGSTANAGEVDVIYGSPTGLAADGAVAWDQGFLAGDGAEANDRFGFALAAGNFGKGAQQDLAVGVPNEAVGTDPSFVGAVSVMFGSPTGLSDVGSQLWHQDMPGVAGEAGGGFGTTLVAGNFGKGTQSDLGISSPYKEVAGKEIAGAVTVLYGSSTGLRVTGSQFWNQNRPGVAGNGPQDRDAFGWALAAGNLGAGSIADLAVGVPGEMVGGKDFAGAVNVFYGSPSGLRASGSEFWHQDKPGAAGDGVQTNDHFGLSLAIGNFGRTSQADLAVGVFGEGVVGTVRTGAVNVLYGTADGLAPTGSQFWHQDRSGLAGDGAEQDDAFGWAIAAVGLGKDGRSDLAIDAGGEDVETVSGAGAVTVVYGSPTGLRVNGSQWWHQGVPGVSGDGAESFDSFGWTLYGSSNDPAD
jgi:disulfide bond formation protein DsbB